MHGRYLTYNRGDNLLILGDEEQGIAILKEKSFLEHLRLMERMRHMESDE